jgi:RNA polymerase sigma factor (TIGR02999 family)
LLRAAHTGNRQAAEELFAVVYNDLRRLAASYLRAERGDHTLQATALVHEAYLRMVDQTRVDWQGRSHFFAIAAQAMRRLLVDHARRRGRQRHGGSNVRITLSEELIGEDSERALDVLAVDQALAKFAASEPEKARLVELRFFGGLTAQESAEVLGLSLRTAERYWLHARTWMYRELGPPATLEAADAAPPDNA